MDGTPSGPRPAAALVLLRPGAREMRVFMVRRHARSAFMPDVYVFPGGTVQQSDRDAERTPDLRAPSGAEPALGGGFRVAALRECFEEAGVLLATRGGVPLALGEADLPRFAAYRAALYAGSISLAAIAAQEGLTLATDALLHWAHWITPEGMPRRYDTHFFLAVMPESQEAIHDRLETSDGRWIAPTAALAGQAMGRFPLAFPTIHQLRALAGLPDIHAAHARFAGRPVATIMPTVTRVGDESTAHLSPPMESLAASEPSGAWQLPGGITRVLAPNPSAYTGAGTNSYLVAGPDGCAVIDPGPDDPDHLERLAALTTAQGGARAILITHGHPDHDAGAARLRALTGAPVLAWGAEGVAAADVALEDGAEIDAGGRLLLALHTPGHRFDHLCFLAPETGTLFAGDLVAGSGTVLIAPPEGDLAAYLASLRRLLALDLDLLLPGHGPPISAPRALLAHYIQHRGEREAQILAALAAGEDTVAALVARIYAELDPALHAPAAQTVGAHLLKLEQEGRARRRTVGGAEHWRVVG